MLAGDNLTLAQRVRTDSEVIFKVVMTSRLQTNVQESLTLYRKSAPMADGLSIISEITSATYAKDPITFAVSVSQISFTAIDDGPGCAIRAWIAAHYIKNSLITLSMSTREWGTWVPVWSGLCDDYRNAPGQIVFPCSDLLTIPKGMKRAPALVGLHPAEGVLELLRYAGIPDTSIDTASMAYDLVATRSHYAISKVDARLEGCASVSVATAGVFATEARITGWKFNNAGYHNTDDGKLYPRVYWKGYTSPVWKRKIAVELYRRPFLGGENHDYLVGVASLGFDGDLDAMDFGGPEVVVQLCPTTEATDHGYEGTTASITGQVTLTITDDDTEYNINRAYDPITFAMDPDNYIQVDSSGFGEEIPVDKAIEELGRLDSAAVACMEDGKVKLIPFAPATAVVDTWVVNRDYSDLTLKGYQQDIRTYFKGTQKCNDPWKIRVDEAKPIDIITDQERHLSAAHFSIDGVIVPKLEEEFETSMLDASCFLFHSFDDNDTTIKVGNFGTTKHAAGEPEDIDSATHPDNVRNTGMCGTVGASTAAPPVQAAARKADSTAGRYIHLRIDNEIIRCVSSTVAASGDTMLVTNPRTGVQAARAVWYDLTYSTGADPGDGRGMFGTTAAPHFAGATVFDVTVIVETANIVLDRHEHGCPQFSCVTQLDKWPVQVGDFVAFDDPLIFGMWLTSATKWEAISKEIVLTGGPPSLRWIFACVAPTSATSGQHFGRIPAKPWGNGSAVRLPPSYALTPGGIPFVGPGGRQGYAQQRLHWDDANTRLGIGTEAPTQSVDVWGSVAATDGATGKQTLVASTGVTLSSGATITPAPTGTGMVLTGDTLNLSGVTSVVGLASPDYVLKSVLSETGDLLYASGASTPAALHHGTAGDILQSGGHAASPSWIAPTKITSVETSAMQRILRPSETAYNSGGQLVSDRAHFVYLGLTTQVITPKYVRVAIVTGGTGAQTAELGLFSTPLSPCFANQELTKLVATGTCDAMATAAISKNTSAFNTAIPAGTHLWAGIRCAFATTQPTPRSVTEYHGTGEFLYTATAGALTGAGPWTGVVHGGASLGTTVPIMIATLD
jgi:hypothetical protein